MSAPSLDDVRALQRSLTPWLTPTPLLRCIELEEALEGETAVFGKLEFLQRTGTFKARGALASVLSLTASQREAGVTAVSAGNHALAVAYAARALPTSAKVVMLKTSNAARIEGCRRLGAEIVLAGDVHEAFTEARRIERDEGRYFVHPFEGPNIARGTATLGLEIMEAAPELDAVVVPIGGGGLCAGVAAAVKQVNPRCSVFGVEPEGADSMQRSFDAGKPISIDRVATIADSLGAPEAMPYSFALCREFVDELVTVSDDELRDAMTFLFRRMRIAVEPACAASSAALLGPLRAKCRGLRVALVFCGSNIDWASYSRDIETGTRHVD